MVVLSWAIKELTKLSEFDSWAMIYIYLFIILNFVYCLNNIFRIFVRIATTINIWL